MSLRDKAIGAWELVSYQTENEKGETVYPLGEDATGYIMYTPDGYMSAQLMQQGRSAYESGDIHQGTQEEMAEAAAGYMAYSGRFEVDEEAGHLIHYMDVLMNPTWLGQSQRRGVSLDEDTLSIYNVERPQDKLTWKRAGDNADNITEGE